MDSETHNPLKNFFLQIRFKLSTQNLINSKLKYIDRLDTTVNLCNIQTLKRFNPILNGFVESIKKDSNISFNCPYKTVSERHDLIVPFYSNFHDRLHGWYLHSFKLLILFKFLFQGSYRIENLTVTDAVIPPFLRKRLGIPFFIFLALKFQNGNGAKSHEYWNNTFHGVLVKDWIFKC